MSLVGSIFGGDAGADIVEMTDLVDDNRYMLRLCLYLSHYFDHMNAQSD